MYLVQACMICSKKKNLFEHDLSRFNRNFIKQIFLHRTDKTEELSLRYYITPSILKPYPATVLTSIKNYSRKCKTKKKNCFRLYITRAPSTLNILVYYVTRSLLPRLPGFPRLLFRPSFEPRLNHLDPFFPVFPPTSSLTPSNAFVPYCIQLNHTFT